MNVRRLLEIVEGWTDKYVLVVGDRCEDIWVELTDNRIGPEGIPTWNGSPDTRTWGMGGLVCRMAWSLGAKAIPELSGILSERWRLCVGGNPLLRFDRDVISEPIRPRVIDKVDCVLICDHGLGAVTREVVEKCVEIGQRWKCPVIADPACGVSWSKYAGVIAIKCNTREADECPDVFSFYLRTQNRLVIKTMGHLGCSLHSPEGHEYVGTDPVTSPNIIGAGDQFLAALGLARSAGATWLEACQLANVAAGLKCQQPRTEPVSRIRLVRALEALLPNAVSVPSAPMATEAAS